MAIRHFDLGNTVVPVIAKLNGTDIDDRILEWIPFTSDNLGQLITTSYYPTVDSAAFNKPSVLDIGADLFNNNTNFGFLVGNVEYLYDPFEDEFIRKKSNYTEELIAGTFSSNQNSSTIKNYNHRGGHFFIEITNIAIDATITPLIQGIDLDSGETYEILVGQTLTEVGIYVLKVYPGIGQIPNGSASDILPSAFKLRVIYGGTGDITYSSTVSLIM